MYVANVACSQVKWESVSESQFIRKCLLFFFDLMTHTCRCFVCLMAQELFRCWKASVNFLISCWPLHLYKFSTFKICRSFGLLVEVYSMFFFNYGWINLLDVMTHKCHWFVHLMDQGYFSIEKLVPFPVSTLIRCWSLLLCKYFHF